MNPQESARVRPQNPVPEPNEIQVGPIVRAILLVAAVLLLSYPLASFLIDFFGGSTEKRTERPDFEPARQWLAHSEELEALRSQQRARLSEFEWVDRSRGIVQIPLDKSMDIAAEQGKVPRPASEGARP